MGSWLLSYFSTWKTNSVFWTTVNLLFALVTYRQSWFELSRVKLHRKRPEGKRKLLRVSRRLIELLRVKLQQMCGGNPGEIDFGLSKRDSS